MGERKSRQQCYSGVFGAAESLFVIESLLCIHGHAVADPPLVGGLLCVLLFSNVG